jgi:hypothetical protein
MGPTTVEANLLDASVWQKEENGGEIKSTYEIKSRIEGDEGWLWCDMGKRSCATDAGDAGGATREWLGVSLHDLGAVDVVLGQGLAASTTATATTTTGWGGEEGG